MMDVLFAAFMALGDMLLRIAVLWLVWVEFTRPDDTSQLRRNVADIKRDLDRLLGEHGQVPTETANDEDRRPGELKADYYRRLWRMRVDRQPGGSDA